MLPAISFRRVFFAVFVEGIETTMQRVIVRKQPRKYLHNSNDV